MKRLLLLLITSCVFLSTSYAQTYEYGPAQQVKSGIDIGKMRFGLFLSPNISWMKPTATKSNDGLYLANNEGSKLGYSWGLMIDYFFAENYGIATGFQLNTTGGKIQATYNTSNTTAPATTNLIKSAYFDYQLQYLEVPFGLKLMSDNLSGGFRVFGNIGVTLGINISKKASYDVTYTDTTTAGGTLTTIDRNVSGDGEKLRGGLSITPILLQMNLGGGIEYQITDKLSFYTGIFFNNGFTPDVTNPKEINMGYKGNFSDANTRLNNFSLRLGLFF